MGISLGKGGNSLGQATLFNVLLSVHILPYFSIILCGPSCGHNKSQVLLSSASKELFAIATSLLNRNTLKVGRIGFRNGTIVCWGSDESGLLHLVFFSLFVFKL